MIIISILCLANLFRFLLLLILLVWSLHHHSVCMCAMRCDKQEEDEEVNIVEEKVGWSSYQSRSEEDVEDNDGENLGRNRESNILYSYCKHILCKLALITTPKTFRYINTSLSNRIWAIYSEEFN